MLSVVLRYNDSSCGSASSRGAGPRLVSTPLVGARTPLVSGYGQGRGGVLLDQEDAQTKLAAEVGDGDINDLTSVGARPSESSSTSSRRGRAWSAQASASIWRSPPLSNSPWRDRRRCTSTGNTDSDEIALLSRNAGHVLLDRERAEDFVPLGHEADTQARDLTRRQTA